MTYRHTGYTDHREANDGFFYVSNEELQRECGIGSHHTLNGIISRLINDGIIEKIGGGTHHPNNYRLTEKYTAYLPETLQNKPKNCPNCARIVGNVDKSGTDCPNNCPNFGEATTLNNSELSEKTARIVEGGNSGTNCPQDKDKEKELTYIPTNILQYLNTYLAKEKENFVKEKAEQARRIEELTAKVKELSATVEQLKGANTSTSLNEGKGAAPCGKFNFNFEGKEAAPRTPATSKPKATNDFNLDQWQTDVSNALQAHKDNFTYLKHDERRRAFSHVLNIIGRAEWKAPDLYTKAYNEASQLDTELWEAWPAEYV